MALNLLSHAEQVAAHLRSELLRGRWSGTMPGVLTLEVKLGVNRTTVDIALKQLEKEGLLVPQGVGRRRRIELPENPIPPALRVKILAYEDVDRKLDYLLDLQHQLLEAGHAVGFATKTLFDLEMDVKRVARLVRHTETDAWVVLAGSREVLEWFAAQPVPAFALFGRMRQVPLASTGPDKVPALSMAVRRLAALGHRRIVMLVRAERRKPQPGFIEQAFLTELEAAGIPSGPYNMPDWEGSPAGFRRQLDELFRVTSPTALLIDDTPFVVAALQHLSRRGIVAPRDVSLIALDPDPAYAWCSPEITHIRWDHRPVARRIVRWAANVARGKDDRRKSFTKAEFVEGGTIGPVPTAR